MRQRYPFSPLGHYLGRDDFHVVPHISSSTKSETQIFGRRGSRPYRFSSREFVQSVPVSFSRNFSNLDIRICFEFRVLAVPIRAISVKCVFSPCSLR
jgi:hypothetical protein